MYIYIYIYTHVSYNIVIYIISCHSILYRVVCVCTNVRRARQDDSPAGCQIM